MTQIKFDKTALKNYRSENMGITHQELSQCCGMSTRSLSRREDPKSENLIDEEELAIICRCLKIPQHKLWDELKPEMNFYGVKIKNSEELMEIIFQSNNLDQLDFRWLPEDEYLQGYALDFAEIFDQVKEEQSRSHALSNDGISSHLKLKNKLSLLNAFNGLTSDQNKDKFEFFIIETSEFFGGLFEEGPFGEYWIDEGWSSKISIIAEKYHNGRKSAPHVRKRIHKPAIGPQGILGYQFEELDVETKLQMLNSGKKDMVNFSSF